ncbi:MAG: YncE family protein [Candidatus Nanopelagicaceae bacterium]|nr:YncE family protein [Candidatus Nanopelagicaceae bacterium]
MRISVRWAIVFALLFPVFTPSSAETTSDSTKLKLEKTITGDISPKSVRASKTGFVSAHNMMYRHSVTVYDAQSFDLVKTISDQVNLNNLGQKGYSGLHRGAPVEGAFSPSGDYLYVTNYAMYGKGFNREGTDKCSPSDKYDRSFVYRINTTSWQIDAAYRVGVVPKVVDVTPDNKYVLVTNWCSYDLSVISIAEQKAIKTIKIGAYPRGVAISKDSQFAYVVQMGGAVIHKINLQNWERELLNVGSNPRAVVLSPDNSMLYATLNSSGRVVAMDLTTNKVVRTVKTGSASRSLDISADGTALYVVNYTSDTVSKVRASDFKVLQKIKVCNEPIGITYEPLHKKVWVACYGGAIKIFSDSLSQ